MDEKGTADENDEGLLPQFDARTWDSEYLLWMNDKGPKPGPHPDPNHKWNTDPTTFNFD